MPKKVNKTDNPYFDIGQRLKECRVIANRSTKPDKKLTQEQVAEKIGVSTSYYASLERGEKLASTRLLDRLVEFYGVSSDFIRYGTILPESEDELIKKLNNLPNSTRQQIRRAFIDIIDAAAKDEEDPESF